jgi:hypothetical protein
MQALSFPALAYIGSGDPPKARQALERTRSEDRHNYRLPQYWALVPALERKRTEAVWEMDGEVQAHAGAYFRRPLPAAEFHAVMGDAAKALRPCLLRRAWK